MTEPIYTADGQRIMIRVADAKRIASWLRAGTDDVAPRSEIDNWAELLDPQPSSLEADVARTLAATHRCGRTPCTACQRDADAVLAVIRRRIDDLPRWDGDDATIALYRFNPPTRAPWLDIAQIHALFEGEER